MKQPLKEPSLFRELDPHLLSLATKVARARECGDETFGGSAATEASTAMCLPSANIYIVVGRGICLMRPSVHCRATGSLLSICLA
jgi:hypothetical protein